MNIKDLIPWGGDNDKFLMESPIANLERDMNRLLQNFTKNLREGTPFRSEWMGQAATVPRVDVIETEDQVQVTAEFPGMDEKDLDVSLSNNILTLKGEKKQEKEEKQKNYYRMERSFGKFQRSIALPAEIEPDKVGATFKNGVLTVKLNKTKKARKEVKKISIKTE